MRRLFLILLLVLSLTGVAFSDSTHDTINNFYGDIENKGGSATATATVGNVSGGAGGQGGSGGAATITDNSKTYNTNTNLNTNLNTNKVETDIKNTNIGVNTQSQSNKNVNVFDPTNVNKQQQGQQQGQAQQQKQQQGQVQNQAVTNSGNSTNTITANPTNFSIVAPTNLQGQALNNDQVINPVQSIVFEKSYAPAPFVSSPSELNFGNGKMSDVTLKFPKFALYGIRPLTGNDIILEVLSVTANEPFKKIYKTILSDAKSVAGSQKVTIKIRYQIIEAEAQKSWTTGGSIAGSGTGTLGTAGAGAAGGLFPQVGGTKAHFLYTVIFVKVLD